MKKSTILFTCSLLFACGGSGNNNGPICTAVGGGASSVAASPAFGASFSNPENAFDGSLSTAATLNSPAGSGTSTIRGTMQSGTIGGAGNFPGVSFNGAIRSNLQLNVRTYLNGQLQESGPATSSIIRSDGEFYGRQVSSSFDAIEIEFDLIGDGSNIQINELCLGNFNF